MSKEPKWRATYQRCTRNFYIYEEGKANSIIKILGSSKAEQQKIVDRILGAVNKHELIQR